MRVGDRFVALALAWAAFWLWPAALLPAQTSSSQPAMVRVMAANSAPYAPYATYAPAAAYVPAFGSMPSPTSLFSSSAEYIVIFAVPCSTRSSPSRGPGPDSADGSREPCFQSPDPYTRFLDSSRPIPLSPAQKAHLALRNLTDPGNLATISYTSAYTIASNSHTAYGPGWSGFTRNTRYSFSQDATGEFFGTFLIPSLAREDPHYHRMPNAGIPRRIVHAVSRTIIAQSDHGKAMPNYSTLFTYPITAEIGNLYVPGIHGNGPSTVDRILTGYATDPIDNLITEFLPDVARHIHVRVVFAQRILNRISSDQFTPP